GVTKYTAEYARAPHQMRTMWATALRISLYGAILFGALLILTAKPLSAWLLGSAEYWTVLVCLGLALVFLVLNGLMLAILNGRKAVPQYVAANIIGSLLGAAVATVLVLTRGLHGALLALAASQALNCIATFYLFRRVCPVNL